jgi:hypothetical protein
VTGAGFIASSVVQWKGSSRTTTFVSSTQLTAAIPASDIATAGTVQVTVFNPSPGGGTSAGATFTINNPVPTLTQISPTTASVGGQSFTLTATGTSFVPVTTVQWNGSNRNTTFVSSTQVTASIPASDVATGGTEQVTVFNPAPGGGISGSLPFTISAPTPVAITTTALPDTSGGKRYHFTLASSGGAPPIQWSITSGALPSSLSLDPGSGLISGNVSSVVADTTASFTVQASDSLMSPQVATQALSILVHTGGLGRNDNVCPPNGTDHPTPISNGTIRASISPYGDIDVYSFHGTAGHHVTIETFAQRLNLYNDNQRDSYLDTVLELLESNCNQRAFNDDMSPPPNHIQDSLIVIDSTATPPTPTSLPYTGIYFIRVRDFRGDGRPDLIYELSLSGAD